MGKNGLKGLTTSQFCCFLIVTLLHMYKIGIRFIRRHILAPLTSKDINKQWKLADLLFL